MEPAIHAESVHQSASKSASELAALYKYSIIAFDIDESMIERFRPLFSNQDKGKACTLPLLSSKLSAFLKGKNAMTAMRCFRRLMSPDNYFHDQMSNLSLRDLLILSFLAVHDTARHEACVTTAGALDVFIQGLDEIQLGENKGSDVENKDNPICLSGSFNKLINSLQGIHTACNIAYLTPALASMKLPIVVKQVVCDYVTSLNNMSKAKTIVALKNDGISDALWRAIKPAISSRMFDEFGLLYVNKNDLRFKALIECGLYSDVTPIIQQLTDQS